MYIFDFAKFFGRVALIQSTQFCQWYFECKRFMFLMKYLILLATVATITEKVSFPNVHRNHC